MDEFVARANINHFLGLLDDTDLAPGRRGVITKLLIEEENKLGRDLEQLGFAEARAAEGRERLDRLRQTLERGVAGPDRAFTERLIANAETTQRLLEKVCLQMRQNLNSI